jgi:hypothetical protein
LPSFETQTALDLDPNHKMGATVFISVDRNKAYGIAAGFFAIALERDITATTKAADGQVPSWTNQPLAIGAARLLWLLGVEPLPATAGPKPLPPGTAPQIGGQPGKPLPPGWVQVGGMMETQGLFDRQNALLKQFAPAAISKHSLTTATVQDFVTQLRHTMAPCSTFRVREASASLVSLRFQCGSSALDVTYSVEPNAPHRIASVSASASADPY